MPKKKVNSRRSTSRTPKTTIKTKAAKSVAPARQKSVRGAKGRAATAPNAEFTLALQHLTAAIQALPQRIAAALSGHDDEGPAHGTGDYENATLTD